MWSEHFVCDIMCSPFVTSSLIDRWLLHALRAVLVVKYDLLPSLPVTEIDLIAQCRLLLCRLCYCEALHTGIFICSP